MPAAIARLMRGRLSCGRVNSTEIGWICAIGDDAGGVAGTHHVARVDLAQPDAALDRRGDVAVARD